MWLSRPILAYCRICEGSEGTEGWVVDKMGGLTVSALNSG